MFEKLEMTGICKQFPGVKALDMVDFELQAGEIHTLVGENGAGKSTLIKVLFGEYPKDAGQIKIDGQVIPMNHPKAAKRQGIYAVQQHFSLVPTMTVAENLFFADYPKRRGPLIHWKKVRSEARAFLDKIGFSDIDVNARINEIAVADCQKVEIAKAVRQNPRILIMDEPSGVLPKSDLNILYGLLDRLKEQGVGIVYISHHFEEIFHISDRITVLKDGRNMKTLDRKETNQDEIVSLMVGRDISEMYPKRTSIPGNTILTVDGLTTRRLEKVSFTLREGEVLGIAGLVGAGRTELCEAIFGMHRDRQGGLKIGKTPLRNKSPLEAIGNGFGFVTEDRHRTGLVLSMSVNNNISFAGLKKMSRFGFIRGRMERDVSLEYIKSLKIVTPDIHQLVRYLSGGNQQKVVLSKWLYIQPKVLILDEPTRGIDVGAKVEIYKLINRLVQDGLAVIMVSSELPEILGMSDRILVMRNGAIAGEFWPDSVNEEAIVACASGLEYQSHLTGEKKGTV